MSDQPPVILRYKTPTLAVGQVWCGVCAMLWLGELSASPVVQEYAQELVRDAMDKGHAEVVIDLRRFQNLTWRTLNIAVAIAPTVRTQFPMSTCWEHMQGYKPEGGVNDTQV